jgi:hypothetical protein
MLPYCSHPNRPYKQEYHQANRGTIENDSSINSSQNFGANRFPFWTISMDIWSANTVGPSRVFANNPIASYALD